MDKIPKKLTSTAFSQKKIQTKKSVDEDLEDTKEASSTTNMHSLSYLTNVEDSNVTIENFKLIKKVGKGTFGEVFKAVLKEEENKEDQIFEYAIKAIKRRMLQTADQMKYALSEWAIMKRLDHPFIVKMYHSFQGSKHLFLAMDYCSGGDLSHHLDNHNYFPEEVARFLIAEVILAIEYIHSQDIIYRDLKPNNILMDSNGHIKITDFGLAKEGMIGMNSTDTFWGSPAYLAPELLKEKKFNKASDIYQIGVVLYELLTGGPPFFHANRDQLFDKIKTSYELKVPEHVTPAAIDLLGRFLNKIPSKRIGVTDFSEIKKHPFFDGLDWDELLKNGTKGPKSEGYVKTPFLKFLDDVKTADDDLLIEDFE